MWEAAGNGACPAPSRLAILFPIIDQVFYYLGFAGGKEVNKVEQEELKDQPFPLPFNDKKKPRDFKLVMEKMQEDINKAKQKHKISAANCVEESKALKKISDENLLAELEKIQEDMSDVKQQHKVSAKCVEESESSKKKPEEDMKGSDLLQKNRKRVFIRSRL